MSKKQPSTKRKARQRELLNATHDNSSHDRQFNQKVDKLAERVTAHVLGWGRFRRILFVGFSALMLALAIGVLFYAFDNRFIIPEDGMTVTFALYVPVIASTIGGFIIYAVGWIYIVSVPSISESAPNVVLWYLGITLATCVLNFAWLLNVFAVLGSPLG